MGYKNVCLECKVAYSEDTVYDTIPDANCPKCGAKMTQVSARFKPPKSNDIKRWQIAGLLIRNGYKYRSNSNILVEDYPKTLKDVDFFIKKYKSMF